MKWIVNVWFNTLSVLLLSINCTYAQWRISQDKIRCSNELYSIREEPNILHYSMFFPEVYDSDSTNLIGYELINDDCPVWDKKFTHHLPLVISHDCLSLKFYSENVRYVTIALMDSLGQIYTGELVVENELYHTPIVTQLGLWKLDNDTTRLQNYSQNIINISEIIIKITKKDNNKSSKLVFTDFLFFSPIFENMEVAHPFFDKLTKQSTLSGIAYDSFSSPPGMPYLLNTFDQYCLIPLGGGDFNIEFDDQLTSKEALYEFCSLLFEKYPFYEERNLDKSDKLRCLYNLFHTDDDSLLVDNIGSLIRSFNDPHFYLIDPDKKTLKQKENKKPGPVSLQMFYDDIYVAGIYDSITETVLPLGAKVLEVDDINIDTLINFLSKEYKGQLMNSRSKALSRLLYRAENEHAKLKVAGSHNDTLEVILHYDRDNKIPSNFKPINRDYKVLTDDIVYFRLNTWLPGDWLNFYNHAEDLKERKGLIIDLRNNGGGFGNECVRIASCFIDSPTIYSHSFLNWDKDNVIKETRVIRPNNALNLSHLKVVILGNERTACASEIFIDFLQHNAQAKLVSTCRTAGVYASLYFAHIAGLTFGFNSMVKSFTGSKKCIENYGIEPDIYVTISKIKDLYPYEDKLLKTGIRMLDN